MDRSFCILALLLVLAACEKGVKPAATKPPKSTPAIATSQSVEQTPELETNPRALHHAPPIAAGTGSVPPEPQPVVKQHLESPVTPTAAAPDGFASTANRYCPIMQKMKLNATTAVEHTVQFEGKTVGFCCDDCRDSWASMSDDERRAVLTAVINKK